MSLYITNVTPPKRNAFVRNISILTFALDIVSVVKLRILRHTVSTLGTRKLNFLLSTIFCEFGTRIQLNTKSRFSEKNSVLKDLQ